MKMLCSLYTYVKEANLLCLLYLGSGFIFIINDTTRKYYIIAKMLYNRHIYIGYGLPFTDTGIDLNFLY